MLRTEDHAFAVGEYALSVSTLPPFLAMEVASLLRLLVVGVALDTKRKLDARSEVRSKKTLPQNEKYNMKERQHTPRGSKGFGRRLQQVGSSSYKRRCMAYSDCVDSLPVSPPLQFFCPSHLSPLSLALVSP